MIKRLVHSCNLFALGIAFVLGGMFFPGTADAQVNREIWLGSTCRYPLRIFYYHQHADGSWAAHGWFTVPANDPARRLTQSGSSLYHLEGRTMYFYAETTGGTMVWSGTSMAVYNGIEYGVLPARLYMSGGRLTHTLSCP